MRRVLLACLVAAATVGTSHAFTRTLTVDGVRTVCTTTVYGTNCYTTGIGTGNSARVIQVPEAAPPQREPEMTDLERAVRRRATCASRSVECLPEPSW